MAGRPDIRGQAPHGAAAARAGGRTRACGDQAAGRTRAFPVCRACTGAARAGGHAHARAARRARAAFAAFALSFTLLVGGAALAPAAHADIFGSDLIGATSVSDRNLTVSEVPTLDCAYGILCDADGNVLWSRSSSTKTAMASITKVMTAVVALESADVSAQFTVSHAAATVGESSAGLVEGSSMSLEDLLKALLVHSGNDAGVAIAEGVAGSMDAFVAKMNEKAAQLGLKNTHYTNAHGLDNDEHYSTAEDICVLSRYAMKNETFRSIVCEPSVRVVSGGQDMTYPSSNVLVQKWDECIGVKTGYTGKAGFCLSSAASKDGRELYAVVLGCSNAATRFTDSYKLLNWGFDHYREVELASADDVLVEAAMSAYLDRTVKAGVAQDTSAMVLDYNGDVSVDVHLRDLPDGVDVGDEVGTITWRQGEFVVCSAPLVAKEDVRGPVAPESILTAAVRLVGFFTGDDCVAQSVSHVKTVAVARAENLTGRIDSQLETDVTRLAFEQA